MSTAPPIDVRHPRPDDLVDDPVHVVGVGTAFEGVLGVRVRDRAGNVLAEESVKAGGTGLWGNFAVDLPLAGTPGTTRGAVEVFESSPKDGSDLNRQVIPVAFGPVLQPGYVGFAQHTVTAGETLAAIARAFYGDSSRSSTIFDANRDVLDDPNLIRTGQVLRIPQ